MPSTDHGQAAAAKKAEEIFFAKLAEATATNVRYAKYYVAAIAGLIALFTVAHWVEVIFIRYGSRSYPFARATTFVTTPIRRILKGSVIGSALIFPGRITLALVYLGINVALTLPEIYWSDQVFLAKRCGWLALCNLCFVVFLSLKNTPLSPLAGRSYESINTLHRFVGYTTIVFMILHSTVYISGLAKTHALFLLTMPGQYAAVVVGFFMLTIGVTGSSFVRKRQYELFYVLHVTLVAGILIALIFHLKPINWSAISILIVTASMWFADRSLRLSRWLYYGYGNYCTLTPLPEGATRVLLHRSVSARPGSHVFLWIPSVRRFQNHPFTLVSNMPAEFLISAQNGFSKDLHALALQDPRALRRVAIEGAYGVVPNTADFDKILLVGGGSGATFTLALAMDWMKKNRRARMKRSLEFVWTVKTRDYLQWFEVDLEELQSSPWIDVKIHITADKVSKTSMSPPIQTLAVPGQSQQEKVLSANARPTMSSRSSLSQSIELGRPDIDALVRMASESVPRDSRLLVAASGPDSLLTDVRTAAQACMSSQSAGLHLHLEEFSW